ncbi:MAG: hypothetical protein KatS3mg118_2022 [Paracoccaceae bacterium]|nr:MAG: hypothetical protein KatS3mg118_2022 [Paracoccaceae bacterium]
MVVYDLPLNEVVFDFYDRLKSVTRGYASFDYQMADYREATWCKMSILVNERAGRRAALMRAPRQGRERAAGRCARS